LHEGRVDINAGLQAAARRVDAGKGREAAREGSAAEEAEFDCGARTASGTEGAERIIAGDPAEVDAREGT